MNEQADWTPKCGYPCDDDGCAEPCEFHEGHQGKHQCDSVWLGYLVTNAEEER